MPDPSDRPLAELVSLDGRVAVVTGAARGIGAAIARRLAEAGADVVVTDLDGDGADDTAATIAVAGAGRAVGHALDIGRTDSIRSAAEAAVDTFGGLDIWVNNAAIYPTTGPLLDVADEFVDRMLQLNVRGTIAGAREAARRMKRGGVIVNLSSTNGSRGSPGVGAYVASKHAVEGVTKTLALEFGALGIRVLAVAPGLIDTGGVRQQIDQMAEVGVDLSGRLTDNVLGRAGVPDDIARVVLFAVSDLATWVTGTTIAADAGRTAR